MILVDTSAWIEFFNNPGGPVASAIETMIVDNQFLCINGIIEMEILQGIRGQEDFETTKRYLTNFQYFPHVSRPYFEQATAIFRLCRTKGVTVRKSMDCIIAANALLEGLTVCHHDRDFELIRQVFPKLSTFPV